MTRSKSCLVKKSYHKKICKKTKGFIGRRKNVFRISCRAYVKSLMYSRRDNIKKKSIFKRFIIKEIGNILNFYNLTYSFFVYKLRIINLCLDKFSIFSLFKKFSLFYRNIFINYVLNR